jgi:glycine/D-amino acid oxidase-like deaminating enzyme
LRGFFQFCGCNGRGFNLGPILAQLLSKEMLTGVRDPMLAGFEADRFDDAQDASVSMGDYYAGYAKAAK